MTKTTDSPVTLVKRHMPQHQCETGVRFVEEYSDGTTSAEIMLLGRPHKTMHLGDVTKIVARLSRR